MVDEQGKLVGRITIDDVVDVIRQNADHSLMGMAGLGEGEDTFAKAPTPLAAASYGSRLTSPPR